jgi:hypothetical protein
MKCVCVLLLALSAKAFVAPNARARRRSARCWAVRMSISPAAEGELQLGAPPLEAEDDSAAPPRWNFTYASSSTRRRAAEARMRARERRGGGVPLNIVVLGKPASGKGTIAPMLSVAYRLVNVGVGNLLRSQQRAGTALGAACAERMAAGALLPCELVMDVVGDRIAQRDAASNGWLLDGFPRTVEQAQILVARNSAPDAVIVLDRRVTRALFLHACPVGAMPSSHAVFTVGGAISTREWVVRWSNDDVPSSPHRPDALAAEFVNGRCTDIATGARDALLTRAAVTRTRRGAGTPPAGTERAGRRRLVADYAAARPIVVSRARRVLPPGLLAAARRPGGAGAARLSDRRQRRRAEGAPRRPPARDRRHPRDVRRCVVRGRTVARARRPSRPRSSHVSEQPPWVGWFVL